MYIVSESNKKKSLCLSVLRICKFVGLFLNHNSILTRTKAISIFIILIYKRRDAARASFWELKNISPQSPDDDKHRFPIRSQFILTKGALTKGMTSMRGSITSLDVCMDFFALSLSSETVLWWYMIMHHSETFLSLRIYNPWDYQSLFWGSVLSIYLSLRFRRVQLLYRVVGTSRPFARRSNLISRLQFMTLLCAGHNRKVTHCLLGLNFFSCQGCPSSRGLTA